jgi:hypothetical protein
MGQVFWWDTSCLLNLGGVGGRHLDHGFSAPNDDHTAYEQTAPPTTEHASLHHAFFFASFFSTSKHHCPASS